MRVYLGLVHYPVYNKNSEKIASSITPLDIHDISRLSRTYGVKKFFVITPVEDQQVLAEQIQKHWISGHGSLYNRDRKEAMALVTVAASLDIAVKELEYVENESPLLIATDAAAHKLKTISYRETRDIIQEKRPVLLIFGTAWGLHEAVMKRVDYILDPVLGRNGYNHLSVRAAAAIILDRLIGRLCN